MTFPSAEEVRDTVRSVPLERLLLETDGPFMAPLPFRGRVAHPGMIPFTARKIAEIKGVTTEALLKQVRANVTAVYGF